MKEKKLLIVGVLVFAGVLLIRFVPKIDFESLTAKFKTHDENTATTVQTATDDQLAGVELFSSSTATLLLNNDGKFYLNQNYDGTSSTVDVQSGTWSADPQTSLIALSFDSGEQRTLVRIENGDVQMLSADGQPVEDSVFSKITDIKDRVIMSAQ